MYPRGLYGGIPPHVDRETSLMAAIEMLSEASTLQAKVYRVIRDNDGGTDDEIEMLLGLRHQTASARRRELVLLGAVEDSGERRVTSSGRMAIVWRAVGTEQQLPLVP